MTEEHTAMYPPDDYEPPPRLAALTDAELVQRAQEIIAEHARDIAAITGMSATAVERSLYTDRWPPKSVDDLCDVLNEASILLHSVKAKTQ